jgi:hypothetical protein
VWDAWGQRANAVWKCLRGNSCLAITWRSLKHTEKESQDGLDGLDGLDSDPIEALVLLSEYRELR